MADSIKQQMEEVMNSTDRPFAYSSLLHLHRLSADDPSSMAALSLSSPLLLPILLSDIRTHDEETAALALKCLGFMLYHPSLTPVSSASADSVFQSLAELIMDTQMKAVCNLATWCISVQQTGVGSQLDLLVRAVVHAIDNPFGSLSTTFEAIQNASSSTARQMLNSTSLSATPYNVAVVTLRSTFGPY